MALPALGLLRFVRFAPVARVAGTIRGVRPARLGAINRGMRTLALGFRRRGVGYLGSRAFNALDVDRKIRSAAPCSPCQNCDSASNTPGVEP